MKDFEEHCVKIVEFVFEIFDSYREDRPVGLMLEMWTLGLAPYTLEQIRGAFFQRAQQDKYAGMCPKAPAELIKYLTAEKPSLDEVIAEARLKKTPFGVLCAIQIGSWDLDNQDAFYLRQRAHECLSLLPEWEARAASGDYTEHEIKTLLKYKINPCNAGFRFGLPVTSNPKLKSRVNALWRKHLTGGLDALPKTNVVSLIPFQQEKLSDEDKASLMSGRPPDGINKCP